MVWPKQQKSKADYVLVLFLSPGLGIAEVNLNRLAEHLTAKGWWDQRKKKSSNSDSYPGRIFPSNVHKITGNKVFTANKKGESQECNFDQEGQKVDNAREKKKSVPMHRALYSNKNHDKQEVLEGSVRVVSCKDSSEAGLWYISINERTADSCKAIYYTPCWHSIMGWLNYSKRSLQTAGEKNLAKLTNKTCSTITIYSALQHRTVLTPSGKTVPNILPSVRLPFMCYS